MLDVVYLRADLEVGGENPLNRKISPSYLANWIVCLLEEDLEEAVS